MKKFDWSYKNSELKKFKNHNRQLTLITIKRINFKCYLVEKHMILIVSNGQLLNREIKKIIA